MWKSGPNIYFFVSSMKCYNIRIDELFVTDKREEWASSRLARRIGPDCLGEWNE